MVAASTVELSTTVFADCEAELSNDNGKPLFAGTDGGIVCDHIADCEPEISNDNGKSMLPTASVSYPRDGQ